MSALKNPRHERVAQELAKGATADAAYIEAGYKANRHNAAALARQEHILTRVAEIQERGAKSAQQVRCERSYRPSSQRTRSLSI